jgi:hypothetical protein
MERKMKPAIKFYEQLEEILKKATQRLKIVQDIPLRILLSEEQTSDLVGISKAALRRWRIDGRGPYFHNIEGCIRYNYFDLIDYIDSHRHRSTSEYVK